MNIWKYPLEVTDAQPVFMPAGAKVLSAQVQHGVICLWAMVDPSKPDVPHVVRIIGTGHSFPAVIADEYQHVGTVQLAGGDLIFHVFVRPEQ